MESNFRRVGPYAWIPLLLVGVLLGLPPECGFAQASVGEPERLDLRQTLQLALDRNLNLQQSANDVALRDATLSQERASSSPDLSTAAGPSLRFGRSFDQATAATSSPA